MTIDLVSIDDVVKICKVNKKTNVRQNNVKQKNILNKLQISRLKTKSTEHEIRRKGLFDIVNENYIHDLDLEIKRIKRKYNLVYKR